MDLFTYLMAKKGHNTQKDLFSYLLGKKGSETYTTFSGTSLNISNTLQAKIKNIALEGNTSQETTTGKNLFDKDNQVKVQINAGGTLRYGIIVDAPNKKVSISAKSWNNSIALKPLINGTYGDFLNINSNTTLDVVDKLIIYATSDTAKLDLNIEELQVEINDVPTDIEPYTGGQPSPSPDYPQSIKVVTGEQNLTIQNKNLLDTSESNTTLYAYFNSTNGSVVNDGTRTNCIFNEYIKVEPNTSYTISSNKITNSSIYTYVEYDKNKKFLNYYSTGSLPSKEKTFVTGSNTAYIRIRYKWSTGVTITNEIIEDNDIQLEIGEVATTYVPYQSQTYPLSLGNIELAKIGNYKDYIFKNVVGSPYYNANLDLNGWYLHKEINKVVFDGSENGWKWNSIAGPYLDRMPDYGRSINFSPAYCNYFINSQNTTWVDKHFGFNSTGSTIWFEDSDLFTDLETFKAWLQTNNAIVYYVLATPRNTKITDTTLVSQLENINNNARSYKDTTIIECTSASTDNEVIGFSGEIKVTSVGLGNSLNTSLLSSNLQEETNIDDIQEEPNLDDVNEIEEIEQNDEPIENEEIIEEEVS